MSVWSYRLGSSSLFTRTNEGSTEPKRVVFLSVQYMCTIKTDRGCV